MGGPTENRPSQPYKISFCLGSKNSQSIESLSNFFFNHEKKDMLMSKTLKLETTKIDFQILKQDAEKKLIKKGRGKSVTLDIGLVTITRKLLETLVSDYQKMFKELKKQNYQFERPLHYSETKEFKKKITEKDIPDFLKKDSFVNKESKKPRRVRL